MAVVAQWYANERPGPGWIGHELGKRGISAHVRCNLIRGSANSTLAEVFSLPWRILLYDHRNPHRAWLGCVASDSVRQRSRSWLKERF